MRRFNVVVIASLFLLLGCSGSVPEEASAPVKEVSLRTVQALAFFTNDAPSDMTWGELFQRYDEDLKSVRSLSILIESLQNESNREKMAAVMSYVKAAENLIRNSKSAASAMFRLNTASERYAEDFLAFSKVASSWEISYYDELSSWERRSVEAARAGAARRRASAVERGFETAEASETEYVAAVNQLAEASERLSRSLEDAKAARSNAARILNEELLLESQLLENVSVPSVEATSVGRVEAFRTLAAFASSVETYAVDHNRYPNVSLSELLTYLVPKYSSPLSTADPWGTQYRYGTTSDEQEYWFSSAGPNRRFDVEVFAENIESTEDDLIWTNGSFIYR
jgi:hypothetical protein